VGLSAYHPTASRSLAKWTLHDESALPGLGDRLWDEPRDNVLDAAAEACDGLRSARAALRSRGSKASPVRFGATAAAKALYALRPESFAPWDDAIRRRFGCDGSAASFRAFLVRMQAEIRSLQKEATEFSVAANDIPAALGRPESSLPKLVDEFYWVTVSGRYKLPTPDELQRLARWCGCQFWSALSELMASRVFVELGCRARFEVAVADDVDLPATRPSMKPMLGKVQAWLETCRPGEASTLSLTADEVGFGLTVSTVGIREKPAPIVEGLVGAGGEIKTFETIRAAIRKKATGTAMSRRCGSR
jgi:hypothetical protein